MNLATFPPLGEWDHAVRCLCGGTCLHMLSVEVVQEDFKTVVTRNKHDAVPVHDQPRRGSDVVIHFGCEDCNRHTSLMFRFHKGTTYVQSYGVEVPGDVDVFAHGSLWRD